MRNTVLNQVSNHQVSANELGKYVNNMQIMQLTCYILSEKLIQFSKKQNLRHSAVKKKCLKMVEIT